MVGVLRNSFLRLLGLSVLAGAIAACSAPNHAPPRINSPSAAPATPTISRPATNARAVPPASPTSAPTPPVAAPAAAAGPVLLGIDVLEADGFAAVRGKRIGLLTHPAGVNRAGVPTIEVLRRAPGVKLVALYAVEHGIYNEMPAEKPFGDRIDPRTKLPVYSLYNGKTKNFVPTKAQLQGIDALVIDLQDIGTRSYTFTGAMKSAMEACFANGKEVIVLDRPNPLGGMKVDGPPMDAAWMSDVGRFRVPYVHGLTIGELALLARALPAPDGIAVSAAARARGKLTVIPMRGWRRTMEWPETGLPFLPTSTNLRDFATCEAYPMTGLGCMFGGFRNGIGSQYIFRGLSHATAKPEVVERELRALNIAGVEFKRVVVPSTRPGGDPIVGQLIEITDHGAWRPTELNFRLMKLSCKLAGKNPFAKLTAAQRRTLLIHLGSAAFLEDLRVKGAKIDLDRWLRTWRQQAEAFQAQSQKYWLYR